MLPGFGGAEVIATRQFPLRELQKVFPHEGALPFAGINKPSTISWRIACWMVILLVLNSAASANWSGNGALAGYCWLIIRFFISRAIERYFAVIPRPFL
jgi:hypothetical protein